MKSYQEYRDENERKLHQELVCCPKEVTDLLQQLLADRVCIMMEIDNMACYGAYFTLYAPIWHKDTELNQSFILDGYTELIHRKNWN